MFDLEEEKLIRIRLAESLRWVVSQRLLPKRSGGRVAAFEIMGTNLRVKDSILNGEDEGKTFYDIITAAEPFGWRTFDRSLVDLYVGGKITEETAIGYASRKSVVGRGVDQVKSAKGQATSEIQELGMDQEYSPKKRSFMKRK